MIGILLTVLVAALVYLLLAALTGSAIVAIILLVLGVLGLRHARRRAEGLVGEQVGVEPADVAGGERASEIVSLAGRAREEREVGREPHDGSESFRGGFILR